MSTEVKVPAVGESISSGVVSVWHKKSGEQVSAGDPLFTLETDKVSTEINAEKDGVLQTLVPEGAEVIRGGAEAFRVAVYYRAAAGRQIKPGRLGKMDQRLLKTALSSIHRFLEFTESRFIPNV